MQILFIEEPAGTPVALEHTLILCIGKAEGKVTTMIMTGIQTPGGYKGFMTKESVAGIGQKVNAARQMEAGKAPFDERLLGFTGTVPVVNIAQ